MPTKKVMSAEGDSEDCKGRTRIHPKKCAPSKTCVDLWRIFIESRVESSTDVTLVDPISKRFW